MWLFLALVATPLIEIALFIQVGGVIGLWPTILLVLATAVLGAGMLRRQGLATMARIRDQLQRGEDPSPQLAHGALLLFSGALLLTPGFFTDAVGFTLLSPAARSALIRWAGPRIARRVVSVSVGPGARPQRSGPDEPPIEADYREIDPDETRR